MRHFHKKQFSGSNRKKDPNQRLIRSFFAIDFDPDIKTGLKTIQRALEPYFKGIRVNWVRPEQLHLTLRFLGEISEENVQALIHHCEFIQRERVQSIFVEDLDCFPSKKNPRVIWVGCDCPDSVYQIQEKIEHAARAIGLEPENRLFTPHLTLGRIKESHPFTVSLPSLRELVPDLQLPAQIVKNIRFYRSRLTPEGPEYSVLHDFPLSDE